MESSTGAVDPTLSKLAGTGGALKVCYRTAVAGLCFWMLFLVALAAKAIERNEQGVFTPLIGMLVWLLLAVPILLHIWPILALRVAGRRMQAFAEAPSDDSAIDALRAQTRYWRAAALCHLTLIIWVIADLVIIELLVRAQQS
ncbi:MAG: hypothetical protein ACO23N_06190 [Opitutales bacterium]